MRTSGLVLFVCAGLLLSGGAILGGSTAWSLLRMSYYLWATELGAELGAAALLVAGALLCLPACWLATLAPSSPRSLPLMLSLMFVVTAALVVVLSGASGVTSLARALREPGALNASMLRVMAHDKHDPAVRGAFSAMQLEVTSLGWIVSSMVKLKCCGVNGYGDWYKHRQNLPPSCCNRVTNSKHGELCLIPWFSNGCLEPAINELRYFCNSMSLLYVIVVVVLAVTMFATAYLLVDSEGDGYEAKPQVTPLRIDCLHTLPALQPLQQFKPLQQLRAPLVSLTSPAALPNPTFM